MKLDYIGTGVAITALGFALMVALPPPWWPKMPNSAVQFGVVLGFVVFAFGLAVTGIGTWPGLPDPKGPYAALLLGLVSLVCGGVWLGIDKQSPAPKPANMTVGESDADRKPLTMRDIFSSDFPGAGKIYSSSYIGPKEIGPSVEDNFLFAEHLSIATNSYFLTLYFGSDIDVKAIADVIASRVPNILNQLGQMQFSISSAGDTAIFNNETMYFSRQIFIYLEYDIPLQDMATIEKSFTDRGYSVSFRGMAYRTQHWREFDRFIVPKQPGDTGAQLPTVPIGSVVKFGNRLGTRPFWSIGPPGSPP